MGDVRKSRWQLDSRAAQAFAAVGKTARAKAGAWVVPTYFLEAPKRRGVYAVSAFVSEVHEALGAENCSSGPGSVLSLLRDRIEEVYSSEDVGPDLLRAMQMTARQFQIPKQYWQDWIEAMEQEQSRVRWATWGSLRRHLESSFGSMGLMASCILGLTRSDAHREVMLFSNAIGLVHLLARVDEDRKRNRIYLPLEDMVRFRYSESQLLSGTVNKAFGDLMRYEVARARDLLKEGVRIIPWLAGDGARVAVAALASAHSAMLEEMESHGFDVFSHSVRLRWRPSLRRLSQAWSLVRQPAGMR